MSNGRGGPPVASTQIPPGEGCGDQGGLFQSRTSIDIDLVIQQRFPDYPAKEGLIQLQVDIRGATNPRPGGSTQKPTGRAIRRQIPGTARTV